MKREGDTGLLLGFLRRGTGGKVHAYQLHVDDGKCPFGWSHRQPCGPRRDFAATLCGRGIEPLRGFLDDLADLPREPAPTCGHCVKDPVYTNSLPEDPTP